MNVTVYALLPTFLLSYISCVLLLRAPPHFTSLRRLIVQYTSGIDIRTRLGLGVVYDPTAYKRVWVICLIPVPK
jgi:hypothetical protein